MGLRSRLLKFLSFARLKKTKRASSPSPPAKPSAFEKQPTISTAGKITTNLFALESADVQAQRSIPTVEEPSPAPSNCTDEAHSICAAFQTWINALHTNHRLTDILERTTDFAHCLASRKNETGYKELYAFCLSFHGEAIRLMDIMERAGEFEPITRVMRENHSALSAYGATVGALGYLQLHFIDSFCRDGTMLSSWFTELSTNSVFEDLQLQFDFYKGIVSKLDLEERDVSPEKFRADSIVIQPRRVRMKAGNVLIQRVVNGIEWIQLSGQSEVKLLVTPTMVTVRFISPEGSSQSWSRELSLDAVAQRAFDPPRTTAPTQDTVAGGSATAVVLDPISTGTSNLLAETHLTSVPSALPPRASVTSSELKKLFATPLLTRSSCFTTDTGTEISQSGGSRAHIPTTYPSGIYGGNLSIVGGEVYDSNHIVPAEGDVIFRGKLYPAGTLVRPMLSEDIRRETSDIPQGMARFVLEGYTFDVPAGTYRNGSQAFSWGSGSLQVGMDGDRSGAALINTGNICASL